MAKIYGITPIELREGVKGEDFEQFWLNEYGPQGTVLGWISHFLKADRGERTGKYAVIWEVPRVEMRDRIISADENLTELGQQLLGPNFAKMNEKLMTLVTDWPNTDYIELGG